MQQSATSTRSDQPIDKSVLERIDRLVANIETVIFGKKDVIKQCVVGLLARGHVLIEDVPGIGKTTLAQGLARSIDCTFNRIQFTSDMLPADILGVSVLNPKNNEFEFREGPIFANVVLADEVNRTPPKTQSALLEAMSDGHVSVDGQPRPLPQPFLVLATQNPIEYEGTYTLPEAQLDRFLLRVIIGYPPEEDELRIMRRHYPQKAIDAMDRVLTAADVIELQEAATRVHVDDSLARYMLSIVTATREHPSVRLGVSPRASLALFEASQAHALVEGRDFATPDDVKKVVQGVLAHRLLLKGHGGVQATSRERELLLDEIVSDISAPV